MKKSNLLLILMLTAYCIPSCRQSNTGDKNISVVAPNNVIDPYYYPDQIKNFNPDQIDFSKDYYDLRIKSITQLEGEFIETSDFDISQIWLTKNYVQDGIIGESYQRIQIHIDSTSYIPKTKSVTIYGKSKVGNNICSFIGEMKVLKAYLFNGCDDPENENCGVLFLEYSLYEDSTQEHSGIFKGIAECSFYYKNNQTTLFLDESMDMADGYFNRTFVGTWENYETKNIKKCIWGDYRLPFCFDFDIGDGSIVINEKYIKNGWESLNDMDQFIRNDAGLLELRDKWWLN